MNYLPKNRHATSYVKNIFILITVFVLGATVFSIFNEALVSLFSSAWRTESAITKNFGNLSSFFKSQRKLHDENTRLKERVLSLETELMSAVGAETRQTLLELAGRRGSETELIATVLTHPPQSTYDTIIIDAGTDESLSVGSRIFLPEGVALGYVSEVFSNRARVTLFSADKIETPAVLERNNVAVTLIGTGAGNFKIIVPQDTAVEVGDRILSANISSRLLAVVGDVANEPTSSFKEVLAKSPANIFSIRFVLVLP